jgi:23S rRNA (cytidine1920-2'-O)/16S rRNA (cytidine1409-2'-O)-methyltransferase
VSLARLDVELVRRHLARSRDQARELIAAGVVSVDGLVATKPARQVTAAAAVTVAAPAADEDYVSRGGHKLAAALGAFAGDGLTVAGLRCLDAGASTGGFTDVLLRHGAHAVLAVDVGYGQLAWSLRSDPRVTVLDRTNVRYLTAQTVAPFGGPVDVTVADLSFIRLGLVLPALRAVTRPGGHLALLVKPQFEVGRERLGSGGVVRDLAAHVDVLRRVRGEAAAEGLVARGLVASPLPGPAGNVEYVLHLVHHDGELAAGVDDDLVEAVVAAGPGRLAPVAPRRDAEGDPAHPDGPPDGSPRADGAG